MIFVLLLCVCMSNELETLNNFIVSRHKQSWEILHVEGHSITWCYIQPEIEVSNGMEAIKKIFFCYWCCLLFFVMFSILRIQLLGSWPKKLLASPVKRPLIMQSPWGISIRCYFMTFFPSLEHEKMISQNIVILRNENTLFSWTKEVPACYLCS